MKTISNTSLSHFRPKMKMKLKPTIQPLSSHQTKIPYLFKHHQLFKTFIKPHEDVATETEIGGDFEKKAASDDMAIEI
ncbi:hypothetical protein LIER_36849 [Lithospermum erythrorhizon]|uniref:Uncharacterized protein n=1 Tax=Lithospermum erythrorhizon TaxID=34254 RepID=A0AAV3PDG5_LITER